MLYIFIDVSILYSRNLFSQISSFSFSFSGSYDIIGIGFCELPWKGRIEMDRNEVIEKVKAVVAAPSCCAELKEAGQKYLDSLGTASEKEAAKSLIAELEADVQPIGNVLAFFESKAGIEYFGEKQAAELAAHAKERKAAGEKFCDCPACAPGKEILDNRSAIL